MPTPFFAAYDGVSFPWGTFVRPGGNVVAYVRSTGAQSGDDAFAASGLLVATIAAGVARCRPGLNDVVVVLPGHTETVTTTLFTPVAGAQIVGAGVPGGTNNPNITLSATAATLALSAANMTLAGLNINSATAAVTGAIVVTGAGVALANNFINFTGALGANAPIAVTGAASFSMLDNTVIADSTDALVEITGAGTTNMRIGRNLMRQIQATTGGAALSLADTAGISGFIFNNYFKSASATTLANAFLGAAGLPANLVTTVGLFENYAIDSGDGSAPISPVYETT